MIFFARNDRIRGMLLALLKSCPDTNLHAARLKAVSFPVVPELKQNPPRGGSFDLVGGRMLPSRINPTRQDNRERLYSPRERLREFPPSWAFDELRPPPSRP